MYLVHISFLSLVFLLLTNNKKLFPKPAFINTIIVSQIKVNKRVAMFRCHILRLENKTRKQNPINYKKANKIIKTTTIKTTSTKWKQCKQYVFENIALVNKRLIKYFFTEFCHDKFSILFRIDHTIKFKTTGHFNNLIQISLHSLCEMKIIYRHILDFGFKKIHPTISLKIKHFWKLYFWHKRSIVQSPRSKPQFHTDLSI